MMLPETINTFGLWFVAQQWVTWIWDKRLWDKRGPDDGASGGGIRRYRREDNSWQWPSWYRCPFTGGYGWVCPFTGWRAPYSYVYERIREALPGPSNPTKSHRTPRQGVLL